MKKTQQIPTTIIPNIKNYKEPNLWVRGKSEMKKFYAIELKKMTSFKTFTLGLLIAILLILPFAMVLFQFIRVYQWNASAFNLFLAIAWVLIMLMNGLSNMYTVKLTKAYVEKMENLQAIDEYAILFYQLLNPGFGVFVLVLFLFFGSSFLRG